MKPKGLVFAALDDFPHVDAFHAVAELGQFVDQGDVDGAEDVLEQLLHLGDFRIADFHHLFDDLCGDQRGELRALFRHAADHGGGIGRIPRLVARVDAFGREGEVVVLAGLEALAFENGLHVFLRGAGEGGAFEDDDLLLLQSGENALGAVDDVGDVGILGLGEGGGGRR
jgi:hypothetical protein